MTLYESARKYLGVKWKHLGRSSRGLDCAGLPIVAYKDLGIELDAPTRYGRDPFQDGLIKAVIEATGEPVWKGDKGRCLFEHMQPGDIVLMAPASKPRHLAIVGDDAMYGLSLIHADGSPGVGRVVEHGLNDYYRKMIVSVFRRTV